MYCTSGCLLTFWLEYIDWMVLLELLDHHIWFWSPPQVQLPLRPPAKISDKHSFSWEQWRQLGSSVVPGPVPVLSLLSMPGYRLVGMIQSFLVPLHPSRQGMWLGCRFQATCPVNRHPGMSPKHHVVWGHPGGTVYGVVVCLYESWEPAWPLCLTGFLQGV